MITPAFTGQYYQDTTTKKLWKANSTTPGDWTAVGNVNKSGAGDPTGVETPDFTGQTYRDTATGNIWTSTGLTNADWSLTVQDYEIRWTPTNLKLGEVFQVVWNGFGSSGSTGLVFNQAHALDGFVLCGTTGDGITSISFPNLIDIDPTNTYGCNLNIGWFPALTEILFPSLQVHGWGMSIDSNPLLPSISFPSLITAEGMAIKNCAILDTISLPLIVPSNGKNYNFSNNALLLASVDGFLARCVANAAYISGTVNISGGTNAAPTQGAGSSHDILVARGVTITHN